MNVNRLGMDVKRGSKGVSFLPGNPQIKSIFNKFGINKPSLAIYIYNLTNLEKDILSVFKNLNEKTAFILCRHTVNNFLIPVTEQVPKIKNLAGVLTFFKNRNIKDLQIQVLRSNDLQAASLAIYSRNSEFVAYHTVSRIGNP